MDDRVESSVITHPLFSHKEEEKITGVLLISGDRHGARGFTIPRPSGYKFYEFEPASLGARTGPPATSDKWTNQLYGISGKYAFGEFTIDAAGVGDIGCYGGKKIKTPNIDTLCKEGMRFIQHYSGSTVCAPSRSCLITGQHTGHTRVRGNSKGASLMPGDVTITEMLKKAGYTTGCIGKWGLGDQGSTGVL
jgi:hypothetical protein